MKLSDNERTILLRKKFYKISAWLGAYFPIRLAVTAVMHNNMHKSGCVKGL